NGPDGEPVDRESCTILRFEQRCRPGQLARGSSAPGGRESAPTALDAELPDLQSQVEAARARARVLRVKANRVRRNARINCYHSLIRLQSTFCLQRQFAFLQSGSINGSDHTSCRAT